jgi:hypothetical protein
MGARPKANAIPRFEDGRAVATKWRISPEAKTGWHRHERDYAVVPTIILPRLHSLELSQPITGRIARCHNKDIFQSAEK